MSPYLFILVTDMLQQLIKADTGIRHPIVEGAGCPVLQYADDTLLLIRGDPTDAKRLKTALDQFALATGLKINYNKSTAVPIHMSEDAIQECIKAWLPQRGFPSDIPWPTSFQY